MKYRFILNHFLIAFFSVCAIACSSKAERRKVTCYDFKTGTFYNLREGKIDTEIERTEGRQIEKDMKSGMVCYFKIKWLNDCQYVLVDDGGNDKCVEISDSRTDTLQFSIISITDDSHVIRCIVGNKIGQPELVYESQLIKKEAYNKNYRLQQHL